MANKTGDFVWYELMTPDAAGAQAFYGAILGWNIANPEQDGFDYREIQAGDGSFIGGILALTPEMHGAHPGWVGYIAVGDVDASVASIEKAGGKLYLPARDLEGVGRFAMVADPQGAIFYIMTSATGETSHAYAEHEPMIGHCGWNELATTDQAGAMAFYSGQFGWTKDSEMDMGPMGKYALLRYGGDNRGMLGAMQTKAPHIPVSAWTFYFRVADIDAGIAKVNAAGGQILFGPQDTPGGDQIILGMDPQGAMFALVGQKS
jgi:uncharacterized protein